MNYLNRHSSTSLITVNYTAEEIQEFKLPSFALLRRYFNESGKNGTNILKSNLALLMTDLNAFFNIGKSMTVNQIEQTCDLILRDYYFMSIEEFKLIFERAKKGYFGSIYDRIDGQLIFTWVEHHLKERESIVIEKRKSESNQHKRESELPIFARLEGNNEVLERFASLGKQMKIEAPESKKKELPKTYDPYKKWYQVQCDLFDRLVKYKVRKDFVKIGDRFYAKSEFINLRFEKRYGK